MNANYIFRRRGGVVGRGARFARRVGRRARGDAVRAVHRVRYWAGAPNRGIDDVTLARKVETEILRGRRSPRATVEVSVVDGVVWLRGEVRRPEQIRSLERRARAVPEVRGVENLLHLPLEAGRRQPN
jgi:osmotically-inducible protein OsmY